MLNVGVIGCGFVGKAVIAGMRDCINLKAYDVAPSTMVNWVNEQDRVDNLDAIFSHSDFIFICVPTPTDIKNKKIDTSIVENVVRELNSICYGRPVFRRKAAVVGGYNEPSYADYDRHIPTIIIKSTILPGTCKKLQQKYPGLPIVFNPEFLTEKNFVDDFRSQRYVILGGAHYACSRVSELYRYWKKGIQIFICTHTEAEMVKYMTNCALAVKVALFNEFFAIAGHLEDIDFEYARELTIMDDRIGKSHTKVPGGDGDFGFGGKCFPKDLTALIGLANQLGVPHHTLQGAWDTNLEVRWEQDWYKIPGATKE